ncbi:MAG: 1-acyl-sn-glycerol-3-phosphate acyltransferase [Bacteroidales bacterium]|nr:1-acyl-sn-glycerol-3-phosphate acyltransferase [Bacteroidales bacterium]
MTKWSFGYQMLKYTVGTVFYFFYNKIESRGLNFIPKKKPIIFAANHQNALMDPLAIIFTSPKQPVFLTRADIFAKPILLKIFSFIRMLPVYRIRDGAQNLKNNELIFDKSVEILEAKCTIGLFPEATHTDKRRLRPLKKAVPRIAFLAEEKNNFELDLQIVPAGIYYDNYVHSNANLFVNFGEAFTIANYKERYLENPQKAYAEFKDELSDRIKKLIIHIQDIEHYAIYEQIRLLYRSTMKKRLGQKKSSLYNDFLADQQTIAYAEEAYLNGDNNIEVFGNQYRRLAQGLKKKGFNILDFDNLCLGKTLANTLLLILVLPIFLFGAANGLAYYLLINKFLKRIKDKQFHTSFKFGIVVVIIPILYTIHSVIFGLITGCWLWAVYYFIAAMISSLIANKYRYLLMNTVQQWKVFFLKWFQAKNYKSIIKTRQNLVDGLDKLFAD